ncbi:hypothetical protein VDQ74_06590 [Xanthomonas campestris pv. campestris]|nr:hypothetical protein [Xanthomonas campestris pv. campestris]
MNKKMRPSLGGLINPYSKIGLILLAVSALVFLRGLIKAPSPSDEIRQLVVIGLAVMGVILCTLGFLTVKQPDGT